MLNMLANGMIPSTNVCKILRPISVSRKGENSKRRTNSPFFFFGRQSTMDKFDTQKTHFSQHLNVKIFPRVAHVFRCWVPFETAQNSLLARGTMQKGPNHAFKKEETTYIVMLSWTLRGLQCVSQHMNRPQHASADNHGSNLAMSLRSHSTCCSA